MKTHHRTLKARRASSYFIAGGLTSLVVLLVATPAPAQPNCELVPNGSFDELLNGWTLTPTSEVSGGAAFSDASGVYDASNYQALDGTFFDSSVLALWMETSAGLSGEPGAAVYELQAETTAVATDRYLRLRRGGSFEYQFFGAVGRRIEADVQIDGPAGATATHTFYNSGATASTSCVFGLSVLGTFDSILPEIYIDLNDADTPLGSDVTIKLRLRVEAETIDPCQQAITSALLILDRIEISDTAPNPADIDRDGDADEIDLSLFVSVLLGEHFDPLHSVTSDVNGDAYADGRDIPPFTAAYLGDD
jgi:hypothetical protein